jgi:hypothetical protein
MFYTIGKDFAFDWIEKNPDASQESLVEAVLEGQKILPSGIARTTAEQVTARLFLVTKRNTK